MKYVLYSQRKKLEFVDFKEEIEGLDVTPKKKSDNSTIDIKKMTLVDKYLTRAFISQKLNNKISKVLKIINKILMEEGDTSGETVMVMDEIQRIKSSIINKYKAYVSEKQYKDFLTKIILLEEEFKIRYNQKIMYERIMMNEMIDDEKNRGR